MFDLDETLSKASDGYYAYPDTISSTISKTPGRDFEDRQCLDEDIDVGS